MCVATGLEDSAVLLTTRAPQVCDMAWTVVRRLTNTVEGGPVPVAVSMPLHMAVHGRRTRVLCAPPPPSPSPERPWPPSSPPRMSPLTLHQFGLLPQQPHQARRDLVLVHTHPLVHTVHTRLHPGSVEVRRGGRVGEWERGRHATAQELVTIGESCVMRGLEVAARVHTRGRRIPRVALTNACTHTSTHARCR